MSGIQTRSGDVGTLLPCGCVLLTSGGRAWCPECAGEILAPVAGKQMAAIVAPRIATLTAEVARYRAALEPFVAAFKKQVERGHETRRSWNERMPGHWPIEITVTMDDGRLARAVLEGRAVSALPHDPANEDG